MARAKQLKKGMGHREIMSAVNDWVRRKRVDIFLPGKLSPTSLVSIKAKDKLKIM